MRFCKRLISLLFAVLFVGSAFTAAGAQSLAAFAANVYLINGKEIAVTDFSSSSGQCWRYANAVYNKIWGVNFTSDFATSDNLLRDFADVDLTLNAQHLKEYVSAAALGSTIRICNAVNLHANDSSVDGSSPGHNQIIVQKDAKGFTVIQGGLSDSPHRNEQYYTWEEYVSTSWLGGRYSYIKYIKWPYAPSYAASQDPELARPVISDALVPDPVIPYGKSCSLGGIVSAGLPLTHISGAVRTLSGAVAVGYEKDLSVRNYDIMYDGLNRALTFGKLEIGSYVYEVVATDALGAQHTLISTPFTVAPVYNANEAVIYEFLRGLGMNKAAACGVLANLEKESSFNPGSTYTESGGYKSVGICQWNLTRLERLLAFCAENGLDETTLKGQLEYMAYEVQTGYSSVWNTLMTVADTAQGAYNAAYSWCVYYEIPRDKESQGADRGTLAKTYFQKYTGQPDSTLRFEALDGNVSLTSKTLRYGEFYGEMPVAEKEYHDFAGWYSEPLNGRRIYENNIVFQTQAQTLYARFTPSRYRITFVLDDKTNETGSYVYGGESALPVPPSRENYRFEGWFDNPEFTGKLYVSVAPGAHGDKVFYAKWVLQTGFVQQDGKTYYMMDGELVKGDRIVGGNRMAFDPETGEMLQEDTASRQFESFNWAGLTLYRVKEVKNGFRAEESGVRYYKSNAIVKKSFVSVDGNLYYLDANGWMVSGTQQIDGKTCVFEPYRISDLTVYRLIKQGLFDEDGGVRLYFDGEMCVGWQIFEGHKLYFLPQNGLMATADVTVDGKTYVMQAFSFEGRTLYETLYTKEGLSAEEGSVRYYKSGVYQTGWVTFDGSKVYFAPKTGLMVKTSVTLDGVTHNFEPFSYGGFTLYRSTYKKNGFFADGDYYRYFEDDVYATGWRVIDGNRMFFDLYSGRMVNYNRSIANVWYVFEPFEYQGMTLYRVAKNGLNQDEDGVRLYDYGTWITGWQTIDGNQLYFDPKTGLMATGSSLIEGKYYRFEPFSYQELILYRVLELKDGLTADEDGVRYYDHGVYRTGWQKIEGNWLYFWSDNGLMYAKETLTLAGVTTQMESYKSHDLTLWRRIEEKSGLIAEDNGVRYYKNGQAQKGWVEIYSNKLFFNHQTGLMIDRASFTVSGKTYSMEPFTCVGMLLYRLIEEKNGLTPDLDGVRFYENGKALSGWITVYGNLTYFAPGTGLMVNTESAVIDGKTYAFSPTEYRGMTIYRVSGGEKDGFVGEDGGVRFYKNGVYLTGWQTVEGNTLYFWSGTGLMYASPSLTLAGTTTQMESYKSHGFTLWRKVQTKSGLVAEDEGVRYYTNGEFRTGWLELYGNRLYLDPETGLMATGDEVTVAGKTYSLEPYYSFEMILYREVPAVKNGLVADLDGVRLYDNGVVLTGFRTVYGNGMYFSPSDGRMNDLYSVVIGGRTYAFESFTYRGMTLFRQKGLEKSGFVAENGGVRYYANGKYLTGWQTIEGNALYFWSGTGMMYSSASLTLAGTTTQLESYQSHGFTLWRKVQTKSGFVAEEEGLRFYRGGVYLTGWQNLYGYRMFFDRTSGMMAAEETPVIDGRSYFFEASQAFGCTLYRLIAPKEGFVLDDDGVRFYSSDRVLTGWQTVDGNTFYFDPATGLMNDQRTLTLDGKTYSFSTCTIHSMTLYRLTVTKEGLVAENNGYRFYKKGVRQTGWQELDGSKVYFDPVSGMMAEKNFIASGIYYVVEPFNYRGATLYRQREGAGLPTGDLDGDELVTVSDVTVMLNLLADASYALQSADRFDLDGNGSFDIGDVSFLLNLISV